MTEAKHVKLLIAATIGVLGAASAMALASVRIPAWILVVVGVGYIDLYWIWMIYRWDHAARAVGERFSDPGFSVEVDCRGCGQFNRVPGHRLRDRPRCGRCKARLMPGKRVILCRVTAMDGTLRADLNALWNDEDRLWQSLADHVTIEAKTRAEARDPSLRVVN